MSIVSHIFVNSQQGANGAKRDARQALPAIGRLWPSDDNDGDDDYDNDGDDDGSENYYDEGENTTWHR